MKRYENGQEPNLQELECGDCFEYNGNIWLVVGEAKELVFIKSVKALDSVNIERSTLH